MSTDRPPYLPRSGDVLVALPHTLTHATRTLFETRARSALPVGAAPGLGPRLVLDARGCAIIDDAGLATVRAVRRAAAAAGVDVVVVDAAPALAGWLTSGPEAPMSLEFREEASAAPDSAPDDTGILRLDDAARARLARRRRPRE